MTCALSLGLEIAEVPVVVDGNNLLYAARSAGTTELLIGRSMLCGTLSQWAARKGERVHVVFDGPPPNPALAVQIGKPHIELSFSGAGNSADSVVIERIERDSAARRLIVVSSDRAIIRAARRRRARAVRSEDFWVTVQRDLARPEPRRVEPEEKEAGLGADATREWLEEFGLD